MPVPRGSLGPSSLNRLMLLMFIFYPPPQFPILGGQGGFTENPEKLTLVFSVRRQRKITFQTDAEVAFLFGFRIRCPGNTRLPMGGGACVGSPQGLPSPASQGCEISVRCGSGCVSGK